MYRHRSSLRTLFFSLALSLATLPRLAEAGGAGTPTTGSGATTGSSAASTTSSSTCTGVIVCHPPNNLIDYLGALLNQVLPLVLFLALIMIVFSGVQYMISGVSPEQQKAAKQRIIGSLGGVVFYLLISLLLKVLAPDLSVGSYNTIH